MAWIRSLPSSSALCRQLVACLTGDDVCVIAVAVAALAHLAMDGPLGKRLFHDRENGSQVWCERVAWCSVHAVVCRRSSWPLTSSMGMSVRLLWRLLWVCARVVVLGVTATARVSYSSSQMFCCCWVVLMTVSSWRAMRRLHPCSRCAYSRARVFERDCFTVRCSALRRVLSEDRRRFLLRRCC